MEDIDLKIWEYIDGLGSVEERVHFFGLIEADSTWKERYQSIVQFQESLNANLNIEQPSMRFDQNIMEAIAVTRIAQPASKYINKWVIRLFALLFITPIAGLLAYYLV